MAAILVTLGVSGRLLPHAWNFAPIVAIGIFAGAYLGPRYAFAVPVLAMVLSDISIGFYMWQMNLAVYIAMALSGAIGLLLRKKKNPLSIAGASFAGSMLFFLITNGAVWYFTGMYSHGLDGLLASYSAGLPFLRNTLSGDLWYSFALFGGFEFARMLYVRYVLSKRFAPAKSLVL